MHCIYLRRGVNIYEKSKTFDIPATGGLNGAVSVCSFAYAQKKRKGRQKIRIATFQGLSVYMRQKYTENPKKLENKEYFP